MRWWVLKNLKVDPADFTPEEPLVMSCILIGNCSRWLAQAFNLCTNLESFGAASGSGEVSSESAFLGHPKNTCMKVLSRVSLLISS